MQPPNPPCMTQVRTAGAVSLTQAACILTLRAWYLPLQGLPCMQEPEGWKQYHLTPHCLEDILVGTCEYLP